MWGTQSTSDNFRTKAWRSKSASLSPFFFFKQADLKFTCVFGCQGYSGNDFKCDFEDAGMCGWKDVSLNAAVYSWERRQRGDTLPDSGPSSDYTTGTATGMVDVARFVFVRLTDQSLLNTPLRSTNSILFDLFRLFSLECRFGYSRSMVDTGRRVKDNISSLFRKWG